MLVAANPYCMKHGLRNFVNQSERPLGHDYSTTQFLREFKPKTDIVEDKDFVYFQLELPGVNKDDMKVMVNDENVLSIEAKRVYSEGKEKNYVRRFELPSSLDKDNIKADYVDGVLTLTIPKIHPKVNEVEIS